jgi:hypothetical protein
MRTLLLFAVVIALGAMAQPKDVDGWGKIKWGMTIAEARAAYNLPKTNQGDRPSLTITKAPPLKSQGEAEVTMLRDVTSVCTI